MKSDCPDDTVASSRLAWLHSPASLNVNGYEWGIFRVKWDGGKPAQVMQTLSDFSDLDAAMRRRAPAGCYPEEWGPSSARRLTCACGNPDPSHWDKPSESAPAPRWPRNAEHTLRLFRQTQIDLGAPTEKQMPADLADAVAWLVMRVEPA